MLLRNLQGGHFYWDTMYIEVGRLFISNDG